MNEKLPTGWKAEPFDQGRVRFTCKRLIRMNSAGCLIVPALVIGLFSGMIAFSLQGSVIASVREKQWLPWTIAALCLAVVVGNLFHSLTVREDFVVGKNYFAVRTIWFAKVDSQLFPTGSRLCIDTWLHRRFNGGAWWGRSLYVESGSRRAAIAYDSHPARLDDSGVTGILAACASDTTVQIGEILSQLTGWELVDNGAALVQKAYLDS